MGAVISTPVTVTLSLLSTRPQDFVFWCKWIASYAYIELYRLRTRKRFDLYDMEAEKDPYKIGFLPPPEEVALESPLPEELLLNSADQVFCYGMNAKTESIIIRVARGLDGVSEAWIQLRLADGRTYELNETSDFQQSCCDKKVFSCGDLQMHYLSPMRRWRIFFNGALRETSSGKLVHVKFALLWSALSDVIDFTSDINSGALATGLAKTKWKQYLPPLIELQSALNCYAQAGAIVGTVAVEGIDEDINLYLFGEKVRFLGNNSSLQGAEFCHVLGRTSKDGRLVHIVETSIINVAENLTFGFIVQPNGGLRTISNSSLDLQTFNHEENGANELQVKFSSNGNLKTLHILFSPYKKINNVINQFCNNSF